MPKISLILLTKNEQENLLEWGRWLPQLTIIDEIIVIDSKSTDNTIDTLKSFESKNLAVKVFDRDLDNDYSSQRNFAIKQTNNDWILFLDADETPSTKLINYLNNLAFDNRKCYAIKRYIVYANNVLYHGPSTNDSPIRLFNKNTGKFVGPVHEIWQSSCQTINISMPLFHHSAPSLKIFLNKLNKYSTIRAQELYATQTKISLLDIVLYPKAKFIQYYFIRLGFVDGLPGLIICLSFAFYSFLVRAKLWHLYHH